MIPLEVAEHLARALRAEHAAAGRYENALDEHVHAVRAGRASRKRLEQLRDVTARAWKALGEARIDRLVAEQLFRRAAIEQPRPRRRAQRSKQVEIPT